MFALIHHLLLFSWEIDFKITFFEIEFDSQVAKEF